MGGVPDVAVFEGGGLVDGALDEVQFEVSGEVVEDGLSLGDIGVGGGAHGFESHALEASDGLLDGQAVLEGEAEGAAVALDQARECGAFFGHFDEDLAGLSVFEEADGQVALLPHDLELMGDGLSGGGEGSSA